MIAGAAKRALAKSAATAFSAWPTYLLNSSGPFTARKFSLASLATARARRVLLHPGGPYNRTPAARDLQSGQPLTRSCSTFTQLLFYEKKILFSMKALCFGRAKSMVRVKVPLGGCAPSRVRASGCRWGHCTASFSPCFTPSRPPTSLHRTFGT